jgi:hypothetical protein
MKVLVSTCILLVLVSCKKSNHVSDCIQLKVYEFKSSVICSSGASINEYIFQGKLVYVFGDGHCMADGGASVFDFNCEYLGSLGGLAGNTKINGIDFSANAKYKRTIWHN